jgi:lysophospholipase L1-like esterase
MSGDAPGPFLRGAAWPGTDAVPYPRADPADADRLPADTWATATIPVGVRLELVGDARAIEVDHTCATTELGYRGAAAGTTFTAWRGDELLDERPAVVPGGTVRLALAGGPGARGAGARAREPGAGVVTVHLPEGLRPRITAVRAAGGGTIEPAPPGPRWLCYGDSIAEGWASTGPGRAWPALAARRHGLDVVNLGYAGAARGEVASAEQLAARPADALSISHGTNCWARIPHSADQVAAGMSAFLEIVRQGHPGAPVVVASPVVRPDAESTPNRLGATLADLRAAIEGAVEARIAAGDRRLTLVRGGPLLGAGDLVDGIHPGDAGHAKLAEAIGGAVAAAIAGEARAARAPAPGGPA